MIVEHPQIWFTMFVSFAIVGSFLYVSTRFLNIAYEAQSELANVRIGAIQDAFAPLAGELWNDPEKLRAYMREIADINPTITLFSVAQKQDTGWHVILSIDPRYEGTNIIGDDFFLNLAVTDPSRSFTVQTVDGSERRFRTARAILAPDKTILGVATTEQTLSAADQNLARSIQSGIIALVVILALLLFLFFRHARIIDYTELYRKLQEVDHLKDDFISMASHELRTPLTAIRGYAELARGDLPPDKRVQALQRIDISAKALDALIADMLDVTRIEQGRMSFEEQDLDPTSLLEETITFMEPLARDKKLELGKTLANSALVHVDPTRFKQIATNLIGNAIKYTDKGSVSVETKIIKDKWILRVSDTGFGMSAETREHLFEKFYRASNKETRAKTGTGLGLWITKQLIERMHGEISVESIEGVGSHFVVTFPLVTAPGLKKG